jgi:hypothetical protein
MTQDATEGIKHVTDAVSVLTVIGTLAQILPAIAAVLSIIWTCFRIYELRTVQKLLGKIKE